MTILRHSVQAKVKLNLCSETILGKSPFMNNPVLSIKNFKTSYFNENEEMPAVKGISFNVSPGEILGIVGGGLL